MKIAEALDDYLVTSNLREPSKKEKKFYLSDMGKCMRVRWLKRRGIKTELDPYVNWIFQMGDLIHDFGYKALEAQGLLLEAEDYVENDDFIGRFDGIIKNGKGKSVFDFKSVGSYKMNKVIKGEDDEGNIMQLLTYVMFLQKDRKDINNSAYCIYINKEPSKRSPQVFVEKEYHLTKWRKQKIQDEIDQLVEFWHKDEIPPCSCPSWMKAYNAYQPFCMAKEKDIRKILEYVEQGKEVISTNQAVFLVTNNKRKVIL